ncbi:MAG: aldose 1-epimerase family protein [Bacillota bacterium]
MVKTIQNGFLTVKINSLGSELISVIDNNNIEYIYQPSDLWIGQAKNLFPNVGNILDDTIVVKGKEYHLCKHGFAKTMEFELANHEETKLSFLLKSSEETKRFLPYDYSFYIHFSLDENRLFQTYEVVNDSDEAIYFGVGAHTGFITDEESYIEFGKEESVVEILREDMMYLTGQKKPFPLPYDGNKLKLEVDTFDGGACILENFKEKYVTLHNPILQTKVTVKFSNFPYMTLWSEANSNEFVCVEPWQALPDAKSTNQNFEEKEGNICLQKGEKFSATQEFIFAHQ